MVNIKKKITINYNYKKKGKLFVYSESNRSVKETEQIHTEPIKLLNWSPDGTRLVVVDNVKYIVILNLFKINF
jgi:WD40 repeat protein